MEERGKEGKAEWRSIQGERREREKLVVFTTEALRMYRRIMGFAISKRPPLQRAIYRGLQRQKSDWRLYKYSGTRVSLASRASVNVAERHALVPISPRENRKPESDDSSFSLRTERHRCTRRMLMDDIRSGPLWERDKRHDWCKKSKLEISETLRYHSSDVASEVPSLKRAQPPFRGVKISNNRVNRIRSLKWPALKVDVKRFHR